MIVRYSIFSDNNKFVDFCQQSKIVCSLGHILWFCVVFVKKCGVWNFAWPETDLTSFDIAIPYMFSS